jgi:hypothetical protein
MSPAKDVHILISRTCKSITLHTKRLCDYVKGIDMDRLAQIIWSQCDHKSPYEGSRTVKIKSRGFNGSMD